MTPLEALYADGVNLAAERSPFGHPLPNAEVRAVQAGVDAAVAALTPRVVTTAAELDALPAGVVVVATHGDAFESQARLGGGVYWLTIGDEQAHSSAHVAHFGPLIVVWTPPEGGRQ